MDYLEFVYSGKGNISLIFDVCRAFYHSEKQDRSLMEFFMEWLILTGELWLQILVSSGGSALEAKFQRTLAKGRK